MRLSRLRRGQERYYLETVASGREDHRVTGLEPDGAWLGRGAALLGLSGRVEGTPLATVLDGADPATGERLSPTHRRVQVVGLDLTFAAPKQVSLLFGLGSPGTADQTMTSHQAAVAASIGYLERRAVWARRQRQGDRWALPTDGVIAGAFLHRTSRLADPHVHSHVLLANLVRGVDGRWSALDSRSLYAHATAAGWLYRAQLRAELCRRLGIEFVPDRDGRFVVAGMDPALSRAFSQRRLQIECQLAAWGATGEAAARAAALATRPEKDLDRPLGELQRWWRERAMGMGMSAEGADRFVGRVARAEPGRPDLEGLAPRLLGPGGRLAGLPSFSRPELLQALCGALPSGAEVAEVEELADSLLTSDRIVRRGVAGDPGEAVASGQTWRMSGRPWGRGGPDRWVAAASYRAEEATLAKAGAARADATRADGARPEREGAGPGRESRASEQLVAQALERRPGLSPEEQAAVRSLVAIAEGVVVLDGPAGPRYDVLDAAREAWEAAGRRVVGAAPGRAEAAQLAAVTGIRPVGIERGGTGALPPGPGWWIPTRRPPPATVIVATAAEALDHRQLDRLIDAAEGATLVLAGRVTGTPGREEAIVARLARRQGAISLQNAISFEKQGLAALAARATPDPASGRSQAALGAGELTVGLGDRGSVTFSHSAPAARARIVDDWLAAVGRPPPVAVGHASVPVAMVTDQAEVGRLNALARAGLSSRGLLGELVTRRPLQLAVGEQLVARWGTARSGLSAGQRVTVEGLDRAGRRLALRAHDGRSLAVPLRDVQRGQLAHAYALSAREAARAAPRHLLVLGTAEGLSRTAPPDRGLRSTQVDYYTVAGAELFLLPGGGQVRGRAEALLGRAAEVAAPPGVVALIGRVPDDAAARAAWRRAAAAIESYRLRWGQVLSELEVRDPRATERREPDGPLASMSGAPRPDELRRVVDRADALAQVRTARQRLGLDRDQELALLREATLGSSHGRLQVPERGQEPGLELAREGPGLSR